MERGYVDRIWSYLLDITDGAIKRNCEINGYSYFCRFVHHVVVVVVVVVFFPDTV